MSVLGGYMLILPYLILSLKRVYAESNGAIVLKGTVVLFLTLVLNNVASSVAIRVTLALM